MSAPRLSCVGVAGAAGVRGVFCRRSSGSVENILRAAGEMEIDYPIATDSDYTIWHAFRNEYWPARTAVVSVVEGRSFADPTWLTRSLMLALWSLAALPLLLSGIFALIGIRQASAASA
jgi:hypothetical protein